jgi:hypothetical protein
MGGAYRYHRDGLYDMIMPGTTTNTNAIQKTVNYLGLKIIVEAREIEEILKSDKV